MPHLWNLKRGQEANATAQGSRVRRALAPKLRSIFLHRENILTAAASHHHRTIADRLEPERVRCRLPVHRRTVLHLDPVRRPARAIGAFAVFGDNSPPGQTCRPRETGLVRSRLARSRSGISPPAASPRVEPDFCSLQLDSKKAPDDAGALELFDFSRDQYLAAIGAPPQLKR